MLYAFGSRPGKSCKTVAMDIQHGDRTGLAFVDLCCGAGTFVRSNVRDVGLVKRLRDAARLAGVARIDLVAGSPPCQTLSHAHMGRHAVHVAQDLLCLEVLRVAHALRAPYVLIENVQGMGTKRAGDMTVLQRLQQAMEAHGYVVEHRVINSLDVGVPQARKRLFVLGVKRRRPVTVTGMPGFEWPGQANHHHNNHNHMLCVRPYLLPAADQRLREPYDTWMSTNKMQYYLDRKLGTNGNFVSFVDPDAPSRTIRAGYGKSRGQEALLLYDARGHITQDAGAARRMRMLSDLECARLQSFPDDYVFAGGAQQRYEQIGNAVAPRVAEALGRALLRFHEEQ